MAEKEGVVLITKMPFIAAVSLTAKYHPIEMNMNVVEGFRHTEIARWARPTFRTRLHGYFRRIGLFFRSHTGLLPPISYNSRKLMPDKSLFFCALKSTILKVKS